jgi:hypothetical protein
MGRRNLRRAKARWPSHCIREAGVAPARLAAFFAGAMVVSLDFLAERDRRALTAAELRADEAALPAATATAIRS